MLPTDSTWHPWQKFSFRFFFLFLGITSYCCLDATTYMLYNDLHATRLDISILYDPVRGALVWLDKYIFHLGYNPARHQGWPADNHLGVLFYLAVFSLSVIGSIVWAGLARKRTNYDRLSWWFRLYLRYVLSIVLLGYGIDKLIPVQMRYPNVFMMVTPFGYFTRFNVLWNSIGAAPGYMMFTGATEILAALLLLSRRTAVAGYVLATLVMTNVFAINLFYNITVKLFSGQLLLITLYLLAPYLRPLYRFLFRDNASPLARPQHGFQTRWKRYSLMSTLIVLPLAAIIIYTIGGLKRYSGNLAIYRKEKIYDVTTFMAKDTLPPLTTDTLRWKRFLLFNSWRNDMAAVLGMDDEAAWYSYNLDTVRKTFTLYDDPDTTTWKVLHYTYPSKDRLQLTGNWRGQNIRVSLKEYPVDSMPINREKIALIRD